jgi:hypothetical protein
MRWFKSTVSTVWGLVSLKSPAPTQAPADRTEQIRVTMLEILGSGGCALNPRLRRRLQFAVDTESLWYLRSDWMATLAATQGEQAAKRHVDRINILFEGLLPEGLQSRSRTLLH